MDNSDINAINEAYVNLVKEEYTYMYNEIDVNKLTLYDLLVLMHEIEYKYNKIWQNNLLNKISYNKWYDLIKKCYMIYRNIIRDCIYSFIKSHHPMPIKICYYYMSEPCTLYANELINIMANDHKYPVTTKLLRNKYKLAEKEKELAIKSPPISFTKKIISSKDVQDSLSIDYTNLLKKDKILGNAHNGIKILNNPSYLKDINTIMHATTVTLNIVHYGGPVILEYNYIADEDPKYFISEEDLEKLSNLSTSKWDKELEQEFGI